jgi:hypothetical protein
MSKFVVIAGLLFVVSNAWSADTNLWCKLTSKSAGTTNPTNMFSEDTEEYAELMVKDNFKSRRNSDTYYGTSCVTDIELKLTEIYNSKPDRTCYSRVRRNDDAFSWTIPETWTNYYEVVASYSLKRDTLKYSSVLDPDGYFFLDNYECEITEGSNSEKINSLGKKQQEISKRLREEQKKKNKL